jgi:adenylylsulfate kinase-like enzyme
MPDRLAVILVTGAQAAGKSTVGRLLAERFTKAAFIDGDVMWKLVVSGREDMTADPTAGALEQLDLRYRNGAALADSFFAHGFTAVHADIVLEVGIRRYAAMVFSRPLYVVMLRPSPECVVEREKARGTTAYRDWDTIEEGVAQFYEWIDNTPRTGLWLDSTGQTPDQTVDEIWARVWDEGRVD